MRPARLWRLARGNLARELGALLVSAGGVALGIGCLVFFLAMGRGVRKVVGDVFPVSTREVEVVVPQVGIGSFLGEMKLDEALVARLRALPGVAAAYPRLALRIPAVTRYNGLFFGRELHMGLELVGSGVPADLVAGDARMPFADEGEGKPIPIVLNRRFLEIYNKVFAPQRGLPTLTDTMLVVSIDPVTGRSAMVSVPRHLYGAHLPDGRNYNAKLNSLLVVATLDRQQYPLGGVTTLKGAIGELLGVRIAYFAAVNLLTNVQVTKWCAVRGAANLGLLAQTLQDFGTQVGGVELGH